MPWASHHPMVNKRNLPSMLTLCPLSLDKVTFLVSRKLSKTCTCTGNLLRLRGKMNPHHRQWLSGLSITPGLGLMEIVSEQLDSIRISRSGKISSLGRGKTTSNQERLSKSVWFIPPRPHMHKMFVVTLLLSRILDQIGSHPWSAYLMMTCSLRLRVVSWQSPRMNTFCSTTFS